MGWSTWSAWSIAGPRCPTTTDLDSGGRFTPHDERAILIRRAIKHLGVYGCTPTVKTGRLRDYRCQTGTFRRICSTRAHANSAKRFSISLNWTTACDMQRIAWYYRPCLADLPPRLQRLRHSRPKSTERA